MTIRRDHRRESAAMLAGMPALLFLGLVLLIPLALFVARGIEESGAAAYGEALLDPVFRNILAQTFAVGLVATLVSLLIAYPLAHLLATTTPFWAAVGFFFVLLPFWTSIVVRSYAWMILL